ncbi:MAG: hypothetical protein AAF960_10605 [Bacteroidota bacterium]
MATAAETTKYWGLFFVSTVIMIAMLIWLNEWFWLALPFSLTYLVKALGVVDSD